MMPKMILLCCFMALANAAAAASPHRTPRIAGGVDVKPGQVPYYVTLYLNSSILGDSKPSCGGAILNDQWILTSAFCVGDVSELSVLAGSIYRNKPTKTNQWAEIAFAIRHPKYLGVYGPFDIALLKLKTPLKFNKFVSPIGLAPAGSIPSGNGKIMGLGSVTPYNQGLKYPNILQIVSLPIIKNDECARLVDQVFENKHFSFTDEWRFCAGPTKSNQGHCLDDYGSPLISEVNGKDVIVGVANYGFAPECTTPNAPSIYTRVSAFNNWIAETIESN